MEHSPDDPVCVIKVDANCCPKCPGDFRKILLEINGVLDVSYDPKTKVATIRGKFDPFMLTKTIKKSGKTAELISYNKNPLHEAQSSTSRNSNNYHHPSGNTHIKREVKGKAKVGEKKRNERRAGSKDDGDDNSDDIHQCEDFVSTKDKKYHKAEAYEPP
ncbi:heavy metal-associated isoprenylated plant protein 32-like [Nicotiana tomentosiformis]|uniref:heavy metal-associated isoprenylated plant protein 32-like n=1 Tax=Nicotiana tomentosiformis TaxID=4098 RepID=UPI00388CECE4